MKKRILSLLLILNLIFGCISTYANFDAKQTEYSDVKFNSISFLNSIGILQGDENGNLNPENKVTRAEFTALLLRMFKYDNMGTPFERKYHDVTENEWFASYVTIATSIGLINGYDNGNFGPNDLVTYEQACKIIVSALGYGDSAENKAKNGQNPNNI